MMMYDNVIFILYLQSHDYHIVIRLDIKHILSRLNNIDMYIYILIYIYTFVDFLIINTTTTSNLSQQNHHLSTL